MQNSTKRNMVPLDTVCEIRFGLYVPNTAASGSVTYLQVRQFSDDGRLVLAGDEFVNLDQKTEPYLLKDGDVLFVAKGNRLFAWCYSKEDQPAIASSSFFVLRPKKNIVYPEYLTAVLNAASSKASFQQIGAGTNIFSIRKAELLAFQIALPALSTQRKIASFAAICQRDIELSEAIIQEKRKLYSEVFLKLTK